MKLRHSISRWVLGALLAYCTLAGASTRLELSGYTDGSGAITVLNGGDSADPYFAMQALLLAHDNGMNISGVAEKFVRWLVPQQKPDGTFDRFCRGPDQKWMSCKVADADDSLLAIWMRLLETMPLQLRTIPAWTKSYSISEASLNHLFQPSRGIYMVSPVYLHGLFMDNLEVWSLSAHSKQTTQKAAAEKLKRAINETFWDPVNKRFLVSTQLEQKTQPEAFYPDKVAQVFPLLVDFPVPGGDARSYYRNWMKMHRAEWLRQGETDYPWGLLAVLALRQGDLSSAQCWIRVATPLRHGSRWAITDEASYQILVSKGIAAAPKLALCK